MTLINRYLIVLVMLSFACSAPKEEKVEDAQEQEATSLAYPQEKHFKNMRQLTFGGDNAEAYWSYDDTKLVLQIKNPAWEIPCDQIFYFEVDNADLSSTRPPMISTGLGRTTCAYFLPGDTTFVYASTHLGGDACPAEPERRADGKYLWPVYDTYDIFSADMEGNILQQLTNEPGYDAEATVSAQGDKIVFTSDRSGDLELYTMDLDGSNVKQITNEMELYICNVDGSDLKQLTELGKANWAPFFHPSGEKVIFSSNHKGSRGYEFNLFMINIDGTGLEQISYDGIFDAFPMFSYDGKRIVFSSNRNNGGTRDTNLFVADWVD